jgi:hypothetical protein
MSARLAGYSTRTLSTKKRWRHLRLAEIDTRHSSSFRQVAKNKVPVLKPDHWYRVQQVHLAMGGKKKIAPSLFVLYG